MKRTTRDITALGACTAVYACASWVLAEPPRAARGSTGAIDIASTAPLRAKAVRDATSPILARVNPLGGDRYRVEYIGAIEGTFDLATLIERSDGRAAEALPDLRVEIYSQLPPNHGTDVFGQSATGFSFAAHYSTFLWVVAAGWCAVPAYFIVRRALRAKPVPAPPPPREPTAAERLLTIVAEARTRELDTNERGRLELLLLQELRTTAGDHASLAAAIASLREDDASARIVRAVESWLHAPTAGDRARALAEIDSLYVLRGSNA